MLGMTQGVFTEEELDDIYDYCKEKEVRIQDFVRSVLLDAIAS